MAILPLLNRSAFERGDRDAAGSYLPELAHCLRSDPTDEECEAAAQVLDRIAAKGHAAWKACGFIAANRPNTFNRDYELWLAVADLVWKGIAPMKARARVTIRYGLSASRVKAICISLDRADAESRYGHLD